MDQYDPYLHVPDPLPPVRPFLFSDEPQLTAVTCSSYPPLWPFMLLYFIWIRFDPAPERGGRMSPWLRGIRFWKFFAEYYPASYVPFLRLYLEP